MSKTILYIGASVDGFIAAPDDDITWMEQYNDVDYGYKEFEASIGLVILGRKAYDVGIDNGWGWPHPVPGIILSEDTPKMVPEGAELTFKKGDITQILAEAKKCTDKNIWIGGGGYVAQEFLKAGLLDEIVLCTIPIILGDGIRLFDKVGRRIELTLVSSKNYDKGLTISTYKVSK